MVSVVNQAFFPAQTSVYFDRKVARNPLLLLHSTVKSNIQSLLVSDSILLIAPDSVEEFITLLHAVQTIQAKLVLNDIWVRGGISFGEVFFDSRNHLVVGKGLIQAYQLESQAKYPRVIIDTPIILKIAQDRMSFFELINPQKGSSDLNRLLNVPHSDITNDNFFVSYAHKVILELVIELDLERLYEILRLRLYSDSNYYDKYHWVINYFQDVISEINDSIFQLRKKTDNYDSLIRHCQKFRNKFFDL